MILFVTYNLKIKKGGKPFRVDCPIHEFWSFIQLSGMIDLGYHGPYYTWYNNRLGLASVWEHIDYAFAFRNWLDHYFISIVTLLTRFSLDHCPLLIDVSNLKNSEPRPFKFEKFWLSYTSLERMVRKAWFTSLTISPDMRLTVLLNKVYRAIGRWKAQISHLVNKGNYSYDQIYALQLKEFQCGILPMHLYNSLFVLLAEYQNVLSY